MNYKVFLEKIYNYFDIKLQKKYIEFNPKLDIYRIFNLYHMQYYSSIILFKKREYRFFSKQL